MSVGLDIGTMNIISARSDKDKGITTSRTRDCFIDLPIESKKMLKLSGMDFVEKNNSLLVLGDGALEMANVFGREIRRPLTDGIISAKELEHVDLLNLLIGHVLGKPVTENESCYFSVPAVSVDKPDKDIIYHTSVLNKMITNYGYKATSSNEAMGIIFSETMKDNFSGVGISCGSGMTNVALSVNTIDVMSFSVARGGDWIDHGVSKALGMTQARICTLKESGVDLNAPVGQEQEAIVFYYKALIEYVLDSFMKQFLTIKNKFSLPKPVPIVLAGGTSMAGNFLSLFTSIFEQKKQNFPVNISEIRMATDPLNAITKGMLVQAVQE
jgi:hypothetical protein